MKIATVAGLASACTSGCSGNGHAMSGALRIALFIVVMAASPFAIADLCMDDPDGFRAEIVNRLPLGPKDDDLANVRECKKRWKKEGKPQFAACIKRVEKFLQFDARKDIGTDPPEAAELHRAKAEFPAELIDQKLFQALDAAVLTDKGSLINVRTALEEINKAKGTDWVMAWFAGHADSVGEVNGIPSFGRILMSSKEQRTWANFVIGMADSGVGDAPANVSIIKAVDGKTYFQDFTRLTRAESVTRAEAPGNGTKCGQCHASGYLKVHARPVVPLFEVAYEIDAQALQAVNDAGRGKAPFAGRGVGVFEKVTVGVGDRQACGDLGREAQCGSCHRDGGPRGPLYLDGTSQEFIKRYIVDGHMPQGNQLTTPRRTDLYNCLVDDFQKQFREKLVEIPCDGK